MSEKPIRRVKSDSQAAKELTERVKRGAAVTPEEGYTRLPRFSRTEIKDGGTGKIETFDGENGRVPRAPMLDEVFDENE